MDRLVDTVTDLQRWYRRRRRGQRETETKWRRKRVGQRHAVEADIMQSGFLLKWMDEVAGGTARTYAERDNVVTAATDRVSFHEPVRVGDRVEIESRVDQVGTSSMMIHLDVAVSDPDGGYTRTADAYYTFVALNRFGRPVPVPELSVETDAGRERQQLAADVKQDLEALQPPATSDPTAGPSEGIAPDMANPRGFAHGGELMKLMEEQAGITAQEYVDQEIDAGSVVTAGMDRMQFLEPVRIGEEIRITPRLDYVGDTSMMVHTDAYVEHPDEYRHVGSAYFAYVAVDDNWQPVTLPPEEPRTPAQLERAERAYEHKQLLEDTEYPL